MIKTEVHGVMRLNAVKWEPLLWARVGRLVPVPYMVLVETSVAKYKCNMSTRCHLKELV